MTVKTRPQVPGDRRLRGTLVAADEDGLTLAVDGWPTEAVRLSYSDIDKARTVFVWGPSRADARAEPAWPGAGSPQEAARTADHADDDREKRKQVVTP